MKNKFLSITLIIITFGLLLSCVKYEVNPDKEAKMDLIKNQNLKQDSLKLNNQIVNVTIDRVSFFNGSINIHSFCDLTNPYSSTELKDKYQNIKVIKTNKLKLIDKTIDSNFTYTKKVFYTNFSGPKNNEVEWSCNKFKNGDTLSIQVTFGTESGTALLDILSNKYLVTIYNNNIIVISNTVLTKNKIQDNYNGNLQLIKYSILKLPTPGDNVVLNLTLKNLGYYNVMIKYYRENFSNYIIYGDRVSTIYSADQVNIPSFDPNEERNVSIIVQINNNAQRGNLLPVKLYSGSSQELFTIFVKVN
jgi:hypothetical protein